MNFSRLLFGLFQCYLGFQGTNNKLQVITGFPDFLFFYKRLLLAQFYKYHRNFCQSCSTVTFCFFQKVHAVKKFCFTATGISQSLDLQSLQNLWSPNPFNLIFSFQNMGPMQWTYAHKACSEMDTQRLFHRNVLVKDLTLVRFC